MITKIDSCEIEKSMPIINNPKVLEYSVNSNFSDRNRKMTTSCLIDELTKVFGKENKTLRLEKMTKIWILEYNGMRFNVFSAKEKGTSIELIGPDSYSLIKKNTKELIKFVDQFRSQVL